MKSINIVYFASLRELSGKDSEEVFFTGKCRDLYQELAEKYHFTLPVEAIQVAVNDEFYHMDDSLPEGAKVVFIPPVAGG
jgi:sulfur-carrier protein